MNKFTVVAKRKGWMMKEIAARWGIRPHSLSAIAKNPKPLHWDALHGLNDRKSRCECHGSLMTAAHVEYLIGRLERIMELVIDGNQHMAAAKLNADICALKALLLDESK